MKYGTDKQNAVYRRLLKNESIESISRHEAVAETTVKKWKTNRCQIDQEFADQIARLRFYSAKNPAGLNGTQPDVMPLPGTAVGDEAARALTDFAYFRHRYLGRRSTPWQEEAAQSVNQWVTSPETEFIVVNCPPGSGKSTLFVMDIPLWLICRDRTIRILIGSSTGKLASQYTARIRRMLERTRPLPAAADREQAQGCLAADYGRFKPDVGADIWRREEFTVLAATDINLDGESAVEDKEPTCSAYGMDQEFLGARANFVVWDDLVTSKVLRSTDAVITQQAWWSDEAETRVEPGGALVLQGQRLGANDLYRFALDQTSGVDDGEVARPRYQHILYPAHFEDRCTGDHGREDNLGRILETPHDPYPKGCLLDPWRLPWYGKSGLLTIQTNRAEKYRVVYQQEDVDPQNVLVVPIWIDGGKGKDGIEYPGCWDRHRGFANTPEDLPKGLSQPWYSIATVDPSPTNFWACLASGSEIATRRGSIPIETVVTGDEVVTRKGWRKVQRQVYMGEKPTLKLALSNGRTLQLTTDHRVLTSTGWVEAGDLTVGSLLRTVPIPTSVSTDATDAGSATPDGSLFSPEMPMKTSGSRACQDDILSSLTVDHWTDIFEMDRVHTRPNSTQMIDFLMDFVSDEHPIRQSMSNVLSALVVNASVSSTVERLLPDPASLRVHYNSVADVISVIDNLSFSVGDPIPASNADFAFVGFDDVAASAWVHVGSIAEGDTTSVWDLSVEGEHEFLAEGVIVHNCEWWLYHPASEQRFLLDIHRDRMDASDLHGWNANDTTFYGLMHDWQLRSRRLGIPISTWIIEQNAAQRWLLTTDAMKRWIGLYGVKILGHNTIANNKLDEVRGIESIGDRFRFGNVRLPGKTGNWQSASAIVAQTIVREATRYPEKGTTDDCLMAMWFLEWHLPTLARPVQAVQPKMPRPSWMKRAS